MFFGYNIGKVKRRNFLKYLKTLQNKIFKLNKIFKIKKLNKIKERERDYQESSLKKKNLYHIIIISLTDKRRKYPQQKNLLSAYS